MTKDKQSVQEAPQAGSETISPMEFTPQTPGDIRRQKRIRYTTLAIGALLAVCLGIAWFIFTAKSVYIDVKPAAAGYH